MFRDLFASEKKSFVNSVKSMFVGMSRDFDFSNSNKKFIDYYFESSPVFTATNLISETLSSINIVLKQKKDSEIVSNHPIIKLLDKPNPFTSSRLFLEEIAGYYVLTGNVYIEITYAGRRNEPKELKTLRPNTITVNSDNRDGYASSYSYNSNTKSTIFKRNEEYRYFAENGNELIHLRNFNPKFSSNNLLGISKFAGCQLEISQYMLSSIHNNALLNNQARPSGFLTRKGDLELGEDQILRIQEMLQNKFKGAENAGRASYLDGDFNWIQVSQSVKDMDFESLQKRTEEKIFKAAKIPLPIVTTESMTFSNYSEAKYVFYDNCILPLLKRFLSFFDQKLLPNFKGSNGLFLWFDEAAIEPLEERKTRNARELFKDGIITRDESRTLVGYESTIGGDTFYQPANLIPVGTDEYVSDQRRKPDQNKSIKDEYIKIMSEYKNLDGTNRYSHEYILKEAQKLYG